MSALVTTMASSHNSGYGLSQASPKPAGTAKNGANAPILP